MNNIDIQFAPRMHITCWHCGYDLFSTHQDRCPECGNLVDRSFLPARMILLQRSAILTILAMLISGLTILVALPLFLIVSIWMISDPPQILAQQFVSICSQFILYSVICATVFKVMRHCKDRTARFVSVGVVTSSCYLVCSAVALGIFVLRGRDLRNIDSLTTGFGAVIGLAANIAALCGSVLLIARIFYVIGLHRAKKRTLFLFVFTIVGFTAMLFIPQFSWWVALPITIWIVWMIILLVCIYDVRRLLNNVSSERGTPISDEQWKSVQRNELSSDKQ